MRRGVRLGARKASTGQGKVAKTKRVVTVAAARAGAADKSKGATNASDRIARGATAARTGSRKDGRQTWSGRLLSGTKG